MNKLKAGRAGTAAGEIVRVPYRLTFFNSKYGKNIFKMPKNTVFLDR